eukprot:m.180186 g.180186  ORF g.180186 m.180186 type:complete len:626 (+) comp13573_c3_seq2:34-1911(+)
MSFVDCPTCGTQLVLPPNAPVITCGVCRNPIVIAQPAPPASLVGTQQSSFPPFQHQYSFDQPPSYDTTLSEEANKRMLSHSSMSVIEQQHALMSTFPPPSRPTNDNSNHNVFQRQQKLMNEYASCRSSAFSQSQQSSSPLQQMPSRSPSLQQQQTQPTSFSSQSPPSQYDTVSPSLKPTQSLDVSILQQQKQMLDEFSRARDQQDASNRSNAGDKNLGTKRTASMTQPRKLLPARRVPPPPPSTSQPNSSTLRSTAATLLQSDNNNNNNSCLEKHLTPTAPVDGMEQTSSPTQLPGMPTYIPNYSSSQQGHLLPSSTHIVSPHANVFSSTRPPRKRALIIGINYCGQQGELQGCINDARCMRHLLKSKFLFQDEDILMMTEDNPNPIMHPTRSNIIKAMKWLVSGNQSGDSLFFHFSGHGSQKVTRKKKKKEITKLEEALLPIDFASSNHITDDEINHLIVRPVSEGCTLHTIVDACHSGSLMDLPFRLGGVDGQGRANWLDDRQVCSSFKGTSGGEVVCFSAFDDFQAKKDSKKYSKVTRTGVMTYLFIEAIEAGYGKSYGSLLSRMKNRVAMKLSKKPLDEEYKSDLVKSLMKGGSYKPSHAMSQTLQLSTAVPFDIDRDFMM